MSKVGGTSKNETSPCQKRKHFKNRNASKYGERVTSKNEVLRCSNNESHRKMERLLFQKRKHIENRNASIFRQLIVWRNEVLLTLKKESHRKTERFQPLKPESAANREKVARAKRKPDSAHR